MLSALNLELFTGLVDIKNVNDEGGEFFSMSDMTHRKIATY